MVRASKITKISIPALFLALVLALYISSITLMHPTLPEGTVIEERSPVPSYTVKSYKIIKQKGKDDVIEPLYTDVYPLVTGVKRVGTKK
jgi:hypothetical protein